MPADVSDESQDIPHYHEHEEHDSLEDDPTWTPEENDSAFKEMKDDYDDSQKAQSQVGKLS